MCQTLLFTSLLTYSAVNDDATAEAAQWRKIAYEQAARAEAYRRDVELAARLRANPNDPEVIEALMGGKGIDSMPGVSDTSGSTTDDLESLEEFLEGGSAATPKAPTPSGHAHHGKPPVGSPPQGRQPDAQPSPNDELSAAEENLNKAINSLTADGYGEATMFQFIQWLNSGKPAIGDLFYAFAAQKRREGTPVQKVTRRPAQEFGAPATAVSGQTGKPTVEGSDQPRPSQRVHVANPNDLSL